MCLSCSDARARGWTQTEREGSAMLRSLVTAIVIVWLAIGVLAVGQRGYFKGPPASCAKAGAIILTVLAGPLNYSGANPKISCELPQPSK
jgi:hypothetical protein